MCGGVVGPCSVSASGGGIGYSALVSFFVPGTWPGPPQEGQSPQGAALRLSLPSRPLCHPHCSPTSKNVTQELRGACVSAVGSGLC